MIFCVTNFFLTQKYVSKEFDFFLVFLHPHFNVAYVFHKNGKKNAEFGNFRENILASIFHFGFPKLNYDSLKDL